MRLPERSIVSDSIRVHPFDDGHPRTPAGGVFYPLSMSLVRGHFGRLNSEALEHPRVFNAEAPDLLRQIAQFYHEIHEAHDAHRKTRLELDQLRVRVLRAQGDLGAALKGGEA